MLVDFEVNNYCDNHISMYKKNLCKKKSLLKNEALRQPWMSIDKLNLIFFTLKNL